MAKNTSGVLISIKAFLPTGASIDDQFHTLGMLRDAQTTGDYSAVLAASIIDRIDTKQSTRRVGEVAAPVTTEEIAPTTSKKKAAA